MRKQQHSQLPIILILVTLLSAADWAAAQAASRVSVPFLSGNRTGIGGVTTYGSTGEPDAPGIGPNGGGGRASNGFAYRVIGGDAGYRTAGYWVRMLQVRLFGR